MIAVFNYCQVITIYFQLYGFYLNFKSLCFMLIGILLLLFILVFLFRLFATSPLQGQPKAPGSVTVDKKWSPGNWVQVDFRWLNKQSVTNVQMSSKNIEKISHCKSVFLFKIIWNIETKKINLLNPPKFLVQYQVTKVQFFEIFFYTRLSYTSFLGIQ